MGFWGGLGNEIVAVKATWWEPPNEQWSSKSSLRVYVPLAKTYGA
jgi:hypothetical protein